MIAMSVYAGQVKVKSPTCGWQYGLGWAGFTCEFIGCLFMACAPEGMSKILQNFLQNSHIFSFFYGPRLKKSKW